MYGQFALSCGAETLGSILSATVAITTFADESNLRITYC